MKLLVKLGGTLLDSTESRHRLAREIASLHTQGHQVTVVHGGGKQMTSFLADRGIESTFVNGLRVTTPDVIDAVLKVLAGTVNHRLVSALVAAQVQAVGLSGIDACLIEAEEMDPALGLVGRPIRGNGNLLRLLTSNAYLPVVACVAGDRAGNIFNVNADQMAVACGEAFGADRLIFLTDVDGVKGSDRTVLAELTATDCERLIRDGVATGGMQAKLNAATSALAAGITEVFIAPGARPEALNTLLEGRVPIGTKLIHSTEGNAGA